MNFKLCDVLVNEEQGYSTVTIEYKGHKTIGKAHIHPDDSWSNYIGCGYAETRAQIKALKWELKQKKAACEECRKFVKAISQYKNFNKEDGTAKAMYRQLNRRIKEVNRIVDEINALEFSLRLRKRSQDTISNKIKSKND